MEISMTDALLSGGINALAAGGMPIIPGAVVPGIGAGAAAVAAPPVVPVYDMIVSGVATIGGVNRMAIGGFDRTLVVNALLHDEPWGIWTAPRGYAYGAVPPHMLRVVDASVLLGLESVGGAVWVLNTLGSGVGGEPYSRERLYRSGAVLGRIVRSGPTDNDVIYELGGPAAAWGSGPLPFPGQAYGTRVNGHCILCRDVTASLRTSTAPGNAWNLSSPGMLANSQPRPETLCTSLTNQNELFVWVYRPAPVNRWDLWTSVDEGVTFTFWGWFLPTFVPDNMLATGSDGAGTARLIYSGGLPGQIWVEDWPGFSGQTFLCNAGESITDMWWDEATGRIWASISPGVLGNIRIIVSDDQGMTWNVWYAGSGYGGAVGSCVGMGFVGMFK